MRNKLYLLSTVALLTSLVACSDDDGGSQDSTASNSFVGSWATDCYADSTEAEGLHYLERVSISNERVETSLGEYVDSDCSTRLVLGATDRVTSGPYVLSDEVTTSDGVVATKINITFDFNSGFPDAEPEVVRTLIYRTSNLLYAGNFDGMLDEEDRPTAIDFSVPFRLQ